jgi:hypothetical protein
MSDNFYTMELLAREKARWAEAEMQRRQMLAMVHANRKSIAVRLMRAMRGGLKTLGGLNRWRVAGRGKRFLTGEDTL